jgi:hypothetical protein
METKLQEVLKIQDDSYMDQFTEWQMCQLETNILIYNEYGVTNYFTYDEFCKEFNESVIEYFTVSTKVPDDKNNAEDLIYEILLERVKRNIK